MRSFWDSEARRWVPEEEYRGSRGSIPAGPMIMKDCGECRSPIDGQILSSRSHRREHMKRHKVVELGDDPIRTRKPVEMPPIDDAVRQAAAKVYGG